MALHLGELSVVLNADDRPLEEGLGEARTRLQRFGDKAQQILEVAGAAAGAALAAGIAVGLTGAMELDAARAKLTAQIGDPVLAKQLGDIAGHVYGRGFAESAGAAFESIHAVVGSGLVPDGDAEKIEALTVAAQAYATAWGTDVADATAHASTLIQSGLAKDATHALDLLTVASRKVPPAMVGDLGEVAAEYAQFFHTIGFSGEQTFALLAAGAAKGTWGIDKVGDAVKEFGALATDMSTATGDAYKAIGLNQHQMTNAILKGGDSATAAFQKIVTGLRSIKDPAAQATAAQALFGTPIEDLNRADIPAFLESLDNVGAGLGDVAGASKAAGDALEKSASQQLTSFKNQVQLALVEKLAAAIPYIKGTFGWLQDNKDWVAPVATGLGILVGGIVAISAAMKAWAAVQVVLNLALWTSPITLIVVAVIALVAGIVLIATHTKELGQLWDIVWGGIVDAALWAWRKIKEGAAAGWAYLQNVWTSFLSLPDQLGRAFSRVTALITSPFRAAFNTVARLWNGTIGALHWTVPGWVPGIGGSSISAPKLPQLAKGGVVPATPGGRLVVAGEGREDEIVQPRSQVAEMLREAVAAGASMATGAAAGGTGERVRDVILMVDNQVIERVSLAAIDRNSDRVALAVRGGEKSLRFSD